jgi:hypothetical protein
MPDIIEAKPIDKHRIWIQFDDGVTGEYDMGPCIARGGILAELMDGDFFRQVAVNSDIGTVCWPNGADVCPDVLYSSITGRPLPGAGQVAER